MNSGVAYGLLGLGGDLQFPVDRHDNLLAERTRQVRPAMIRKRFALPVIGNSLPAHEDFPVQPTDPSGLRIPQ
jgi:hypothetical protein